MDRTIRQFIRFAIIGCINTSLDFGIYAALTRLFLFWQEHYLIANFIAFATATINSYLGNKFWTFKDRSKQFSQQYAKFFLVSLGGLLLTELILYFLVQLAIHDLLAKLATISVVLFWNFFLNKYWTFKNTDEMKL